MSSEQIEDSRQQKDHFFKYDPNSPIPQQERLTFTGLAYFDYDPDLDLIVTVTPFEKQERTLIHTTTDEIRSYVRYGRFSFMVDGQTAELTLYETPHGFFLPFVDAAAGKDTYPAGRYLDPHPIGGDEFHVDFNRAYNPFCVYSPRYSCPITPEENRLLVAIRAGERWQKP